MHSTDELQDSLTETSEFIRDAKDSILRLGKEKGKLESNLAAMTAERDTWIDSHRLVSHEYQEMKSERGEAQRQLELAQKLHAVEKAARPAPAHSAAVAELVAAVGVHLDEFGAPHEFQNDRMSQVRRGMYKALTAVEAEAEAEPPALRDGCCEACGEKQPTVVALPEHVELLKFVERYLDAAYDTSWLDVENGAKAARAAMDRLEEATVGLPCTVTGRIAGETELRLANGTFDCSVPSWVIGWPGIGQHVTIIAVPRASEPAAEPEPVADEAEYGPEKVTEVWNFYKPGWTFSASNITVFAEMGDTLTFPLDEWELILQKLCTRYRTSPTAEHPFGREWSPGSGYVDRKEAGE